MPKYIHPQKEPAYRKEIFKSYLSAYWRHHHSLQIKEFDFYRRIYRRLFLHLLPKNKNARILDLACGVGYFCYFLSKEGYTNYLGIDLNREMVNSAQRIGLSNIKKAEAFSFLAKHPKSFDFIFSSHFLEHLPKPAVFRLLNLVYQALKPGGKLLLSTPNACALFGTLYRYTDFTHELGFTSRSLAQVLQATGFTAVRIYGQPPLVHSLSSLGRAYLWQILRRVYQFLLQLERGKGHGAKDKEIFEASLLALAQRPEGSSSI